MRAGRCLRSVFAAALLALCASPVRASGTGEALAPPRVEEQKVGEVYVVTGTFPVAADAKTVWGVLSDYDHIGQFVSSIRRSVVKERDARHVVIEQDAVGKLFFLSRELHVLLTVHEDSPRAITFQDRSGKDFLLYEGSWTIAASGAGVVVTYSLRATPLASIPGFVAHHAFTANAEELLAEVRAEILRRNQPSNGAHP